MKKLKFLTFLILLFLINACCKIQYRSENIIPVHFTRMNHSEPFRAEGVKEFYFFGLLPERGVVNIDHLAKQDGLDEVSKITIIEKNNFSDNLLILLSFGLYMPKRFVIKGWGKR